MFFISIVAAYIPWAARFLRDPPRERDGISNICQSFLAITTPTI